ncbi:YjcZ family sporulation protein [Chengkuizengella sp. SCS-71B]
MGGHNGSGAALVLVLFILLVIILLASWATSPGLPQGSSPLV